MCLTQHTVWVIYVRICLSLDLKKTFDLIHHFHHLNIVDGTYPRCPKTKKVMMFWWVTLLCRLYPTILCHQPKMSVRIRLGKFPINHNTRIRFVHSGVIIPMHASHHHAIILTQAAQSFSAFHVSSPGGSTVQGSNPSLLKALINTKHQSSNWHQLEICINWQSPKESIQVSACIVAWNIMLISIL